MDEWIVDLDQIVIRQVLDHHPEAFAQLHHIGILYKLGMLRHIQIIDIQYISKTESLSLLEDRHQRLALAYGLERDLERAKGVYEMCTVLKLDISTGAEGN